MNYTEVCAALEESYKNIQYLRSTRSFNEAANNMRKVLEIICEYYADVYNITTFRTERLSLFEKIKVLHRNNYIDMDSRDAFWRLKQLGNIGSHYNRNEKVDQNRLDEMLPILRSEIDKFIAINKHGNIEDEKNFLFAFETLSDEGWVETENTKTEYEILQSDNGQNYYVEKIRNLIPNREAPDFLCEYSADFGLPLLAWDLYKRIITLDKNEYFCRTMIPILDQFGDSLCIEGHFVKDNKTGEVIVYDVRCGEQVYFYYDKYARELSGIWNEKSDEILQAITELGIGDSFEDLDEDSLIVAFHYSLPKYSLYRAKNRYCVDEENGIMAMVLSESGDIVWQKENVTNAVKIFVGDILRLHCIVNCIKIYINSNADVDKWIDISEISLTDDIYSMPFVYDYLLGFKRSVDNVIYFLIDTYSDEKYSFDVIGNRVFEPMNNVMLSNAPMEIDFCALLEKMQEIGCYGLSNFLVENVSCDAIMKIYQMLVTAEQKRIEEAQSKIEEEKRQRELVRLAEEEKKRKAEEKEDQEKKRAREKEKRAKKESRAVIIAVFSFLGIMGFVCLLPFLLIGLVLFANSMPKYVNINDYLIVEITGYEGGGEANVEIDYDRLKADYGSYIVLKSNYKNPNGQTDLETFCNMCEFEVENDSDLSNGEIVKIEWNVDNDELFKYFNYGVKCKDIDYKVNGLEKMDLFDAFDSLTYSIDGVSLDATLSMQSTINIDGYPGLLFECDKTSGIANNDIITIRVVTENGEDLYDYCSARFDAVPESRKLEIVVSDLPEYVTKYEQIPEDVLQRIIDEGEKHLCDYYNNLTYGYSCEASYKGNYFLSADSEECTAKNRIYAIYKMKRTIYDKPSYLGSAAKGTYEFYAIYGLSNINVTKEGEFLINFDEWYYSDDSKVNSGKIYYEGWEGNLYIDTSVCGFTSIEQIYPNFLSGMEDTYYIQNNVQDIIESNG